MGWGGGSAILLDTVYKVTVQMLMSLIRTFQTLIMKETQMCKALFPHKVAASVVC